MKTHFYFVWSHVGKDMYGHEPSLWRGSSVLEAPPSIAHGFQKYLLSSLGTDFETNKTYCDAVLKAISQLEDGSLDYYEAGGVGFIHYMNSQTVQFEHSIFGICPEWPQWSCTLAQYKAALQGWRKFIDMPNSIDSELIVELPDGTATNSVAYAGAMTTSKVASTESHVYEAKVTLKTQNGTWKDKTSNGGINAMLPTSWDRARVMAEIDGAWASRIPIPGRSNMWTGLTPSGIKLQGFLSPRCICYPVFVEIQK